MHRPETPEDAGASHGGADVVWDLEVAPDRIAEALETMRRSFVEYSERGEASSAMLETADSLAGEAARGVRIAIALADGRPVGVAKHRPASDGTLYFSRLGVVPEARGTGVASRFVRALRERAADEGLRGLSCAVRADEAGNIALYERLGLVSVGSEAVLSATGVVREVVSMRDVGPPSWPAAARQRRVREESGNPPSCPARCGIVEP